MEIELLKVSLSGIVKRYGFQTVHNFYKAFAAAKAAYHDYQDKSNKWEKDTAKNHKSGEKAYLSGYRMIKEKMQTEKQNRLQKAETEGQDDMPL